MGKKGKLKSTEGYKLKDWSKDMTFGEIVENLWYHYKWWILLGAFLIIVAVVCLVSYFNPTLTDYNVVFITDEVYDYNRMDYLADELVKYGKDTNGDGKINFRTISVAREKSVSDPNSYIGEVITVNREIEDVTSFIFIIDKYGYEQYKDKELYGNQPEEDFETVGKKLSDTKLEYAAFSAGFADDMHIVIRDYPDEYKAEAQKYKELYSAVIDK